MRTRLAVGFVACLVFAVLAADAQDAPSKERPAQEQESPVPDSVTGNDDVTGKDTPTTQPTQERDSLTAPPVSAEDILREFQKERPVAQPLLPKGTDGRPSGSRSGSGTLAPRPRLPDGFMLVDRTGTLTEDGGWWMFVFVGDNNPNAAPDPPIKLLPNQMLERAVRESEGAGQSVAFIVSGEVTDFMGENYLLLRKLMRKRNLGNLSK